MLKFIGQLCVMLAVIFTMLGAVLSAQQAAWTAADYMVMAMALLLFGGALMGVDKHALPTNGATDGENRQG